VRSGGAGAHEDVEWVDVESGVKLAEDLEEAAPDYCEWMHRIAIMIGMTLPLPAPVRDISLAVRRRKLDRVERRAHVISGSRKQERRPSRPPQPPAAGICFAWMVRRRSTVDARHCGIAG